MKMPRLARLAPSQVKLIFNPLSGAQSQSPGQLLEIIRNLQAMGMIPEVSLVDPDEPLAPVIEDALHRGFQVFVACGGDGTIDTVAGALVGTHATLGIIPIGTQNNVALSLGIPTNDIPAAVALLKTGERIKVDVGVATCGAFTQTFLEICSVGLLSALFPAADEIQHGNLVRIGDLLSTLVSFPPAEMRLLLDHHDEIITQGHVVLIGNMPYTGPHFRIDPASQFDDNLLEVLIFANLTKLELLGSAVQIAGGIHDPRIQRYHVHSALIDTQPPMPVLVDGFPLGEGPLSISVNHQSLQVIAGNRPAALLPDISEMAQPELEETGDDG